MILGIDGRLANAPNPAGAGRYCREVLRALESCDVDLRVYLDLPPRDDFPIGKGEVRVLPPGKFWTHRMLSRELQRDPPHVFFSPVTQLPWRCPCPSLVSVLDLAVWHYPESFPWRKRVGMGLKTRHALKRGSHFIAVSESTERDLVNYGGVDPGRITVAPLGVRLPDLPPVEAPRPDGLPECYVLYVGQIQPRKNLVRLVEAFGEVCRDCPEVPHHLVIAGPDGWQARDSHRAIDASPVRTRIHRLGYVPDHEMNGLVAGADVLALVSLWEGFGLPALEAMAAGTAVLASNTSSLPEVVGDSGLLVDPTSVDAIAEGLKRLLTDTAFREDCGQKGRARAATFPWANTAARLLEAARSLVK